MAIAKVDLLSKEELEEIVKSSRTLQEVLKKIGYSSVSGANRNTVQTRLDKYNISTEHFTKGVSRGIKRTEENVFCKILLQHKKLYEIGILKENTLNTNVQFVVKNHFGMENH